MISDYAAVCAGIANNLSATFTDWQVTSYPVGSPTGPAMYVVPDGIDYTQAMQQGVTKCNFLIRAMVGMGLEQGAWTKLNSIMAPGATQSVKTAAEVDRTLGGLVSDLFVVSADRPKVLTAGSDYYTIDFTVLVIG